MATKAAFRAVKKHRKRKLVIATIVTVFIYYYARTLRYSFLKLFDSYSYSCYLESESNLPVIDSRFDPPPKSIFFHETSCKRYLSMEQACAIEAAERNHPDWEIFVIFACPTTTLNNRRQMLYLNHLKTFDVTFLRLHLENYGRGTPLKNMFADALFEGKQCTKHALTMLRYLTLYKYEGIYIDLDVIVVRSLENLANNFAVKESWRTIGSKVLKLSRDSIGRAVAKAAIKEIQPNPNCASRGKGGSEVITRALSRYCNTSRLNYIFGFVTDFSAANCKGFEVYGSEILYPVAHETEKQKNSSDTIKPKPNNYTFYVWNTKLRDGTEEKYIYPKLAKKFCPEIYDIYERYFADYE